MCLFAGVSFADTSAGTTVFYFLKMPVSASHASLAGISSFNSSSASQNPAIIPFTHKASLAASYASHFEDTAYATLSFTKPIGLSGINVTYGGLDYGDMDRYIELPGGDYEKKGSFGARDNFISFSYAREIFDYVSIGGGIKYIMQKIDDSGISGFALTFSGMYMPEADWYFSGGFDNVGPEVEGYKLPSSAYVNFTSYAEEFFAYALELKAYLDETAWLKIAGEYNYSNMIFFRGGYSLPLTNSDETLGKWYERNLSLGFGFEYDFIAIDYAWLPYGELGSSNMITLQINF